MREIIKIKNIEIKYLHQHKVLEAIRGISLDIFEGETLSLVGETKSGRSALIKAITSMLESNAWISRGSIIYQPSTTRSNQGKISTSVDLVEYHRNFLPNTTIKDVRKYYKNEIKKMVNEIKLIERLDINVSIKKEEKMSRKFDWLKIRQDAENSNILNYQINTLYNEILRWRRFIFLQHNKLEKQKHLDSLIDQIEELKIESERIRKLSLSDKIKVKKLMGLLQKQYQSEVVWNDDEVYSFKKYFMKHVFMNDIERAIKHAFDKIMGGEKIDEEEMMRLNDKWNAIKHLTIANKLQAQKQASLLRGKTVALIPQDIGSTLDPLFSIGFQLIEVIKRVGMVDSKKWKAEAIRLLEKVRLKDVAKRIHLRPEHFTLYERQLINIAISLASNPVLMILDEPASQLDPVGKINLLNLLKNLKNEYKFTMIIVSHDIRNILQISDRIAIFYAGQIVEVGKTEEIVYNSQHPYTWSFLMSLPELNENVSKPFAIMGDAPDLSKKIIGDAFAPRNPYALKIDWMFEPPTLQLTDTHFAKTWLLDYRAPKVDRPEILNHIEKYIKRK